jgi:hypothetical protein
MIVQMPLERVGYANRVDTLGVEFYFTLYFGGTITTFFAKDYKDLHTKFLYSKHIKRVPIIKFL